MKPKTGAQKKTLGMRVEARKHWLREMSMKIAEDAFCAMCRNPYVKYWLWYKPTDMKTSQTWESIVAEEIPAAGWYNSGLRLRGNMTVEGIQIAIYQAMERLPIFPSEMD